MCLLCTHVCITLIVCLLCARLSLIVYVCHVHTCLSLIVCVCHVQMFLSLSLLLCVFVMCMCVSLPHCVFVVYVCMSVLFFWGRVSQWTREFVWWPERVCGILLYPHLTQPYASDHAQLFRWLLVSGTPFVLQTCVASTLMCWAIALTHILKCQVQFVFLLSLWKEATWHFRTTPSTYCKDLGP